MPVRAPIAALLFALFGRALVPSLASAADAPPTSPPPHKLTYDLAINGQPIGTRTVTIRYLPREDGERRVVEAYTDVTVAGQHLVCRSSGQSSARGANFTSSVSQNGAISEVQGIALPTGGWRVTVADSSGVRESTLSATEARLSSLDLLDPGRTALLAGGGDLALVLVETGEVLRGTLGAGQAGTTKIGGQKANVTRYTVVGAPGTARFDIDENGLLLNSELLWLGGTVSAVVRSLPPPRSYGTIEAFGAPSTGVIEDSL